MLIFKNSPFKTTCLEKYVKEEFGKEIHLIYDVKTRWNSMVGMIQSFLKIKNAIKKTLIDIDCGHLWKEEHVPTLNKLIEVLNPIKDAVEALSRRDSNLLVADAIINALYEQLLSINTSLSQQMVSTIKEKINERRNLKILYTINYLKSAGSYTVNSDISKMSLKIYAESLYKRLFNNLTEEESTDCCEEESTLLETSECFKTKLQNAIDNAKADPIKAKANSGNIFKKELSLFEATNIRTRNLNNLYNALLTIKPTSVESERVFSVAGNFATRNRNRMSSELLNSLTILKSYFN